jgi:hypothetical protein
MVAPSARAEPWAGAPVPYEEPDERTAWLRSPRNMESLQALGRWSRLVLRDESGAVVAEVTDGGTLSDTLHSRGDLTAWVACGRDTCVGTALLDVAELVAAATEPAAKVRVDEPRKPGHTRAPLEARCTALEVIEPAPRLRARTISPDDDRSMSEIGAEFLTPRSRRSFTWYAWAPPAGWTFHPGHRAAGLELVSFLRCTVSISCAGKLRTGLTGRTARLVTRCCRCRRGSPRCLGSVCDVRR